MSHKLIFVKPGWMLIYKVHQSAPPYLQDENGNKICDLPTIATRKEFWIIKNTIAALCGLEAEDVPHETRGNAYPDYQAQARFIEKTASER